MRMRADGPGRATWPRIPIIITCVLFGLAAAACSGGGSGSRSGGSGGSGGGGSVVNPATGCLPPPDCPGLDRGFGTGGRLFIPGTHGYSPGSVEAVTIDDRGGILVAGLQMDLWPTWSRMAIWRYDSSGVLDRSFGNAGVALHDEGANPGYVWCAATCLAVDPAGRIVVAGRASASLGDDLVAVWRLRPDGSIDPSFGTGGIATTPQRSPWGWLHAGVVDMGLDGQGRIWLASRTTTPPGNLQDTQLFRVDASGAFDPAFGTGGEVVVDLTGKGESDTPAGLCIDALDRAVVVGTWDPLIGNNRATVARFVDDGSLDPSFGTAGQLVTAEERVWAGACAIDAAGGILLAGAHDREPLDGLELAVWRLLEDGSYDPAFGTGGRASHSGHTDAYDVRAVRGMGLDSAGRIVVAGGGWDGPTCRWSEPWVGRLAADGSPDAAFGCNGFQTNSGIAPFEESSDTRALAVDAGDGAVVLGVRLQTGVQWEGYLYRVDD